ncbi:hypothetical protein GCM10010191_58100 [Actinomadura vinacea]|uniref:ATP-binding protein n=1 Tax=Actinomadura vinacea TaxID=115336 RepID=A0ABN3JPU1_9ACTN
MITLTLYDTAGALRCEVADEGGPTVPTVRHGVEPREHGYGVLLIESLADRSGHFTGDQGRLHVWFELDKG